MISSKKTFFVLGLLGLASQAPFSAPASADSSSDNNGQIGSSTTYIGVTRSSAQIDLKLPPLPLLTGASGGVGTGSGGGYGGGYSMNSHGDATFPLLHMDSIGVRAGHDSFRVEGNQMTDLHLQASAERATTGAGTSVDRSNPYSPPNFHTSRLQLKAGVGTAYVSDPILGCRGLVGGSVAGEVSHVRLDSAPYGTDSDTSGAAEVAAKTGGVCQVGKIVGRIEGEVATRTEFSKPEGNGRVTPELRVRAEADVADHFQIKASAAWAEESKSQSVAAQYKFKDLRVKGYRIPAFVGIQMDRTQVTNNMYKPMGSQASPTVTNTTVTGIAGIAD